MFSLWLAEMQISRAFSSLNSMRQRRPGDALNSMPELTEPPTCTDSRACDAVGGRKHRGTCCDSRSMVSGHISVAESGRTFYGDRSIGHPVPPITLSGVTCWKRGKKRGMTLNVYSTTKSHRIDSNLGSFDSLETGDANRYRQTAQKGLTRERFELSPRRNGELRRLSKLCT
jgi:hypothetical protein